jgi:hypothetical protein
MSNPIPTPPEGAQVTVSSLPLPPVQYINLYTDENIKRGRAPKPPPPIHDTYKMFGNTYSTDDAIIRPLESQVSVGLTLGIVIRFYSAIFLCLHR